MKIITFEDIKKLNISPVLCYEWVSDMIQNKAMAALPPKISMKPADGVFCNVMPCIIKNVSADSPGGGKSGYPLSRQAAESGQSAFAYECG